MILIPFFILAGLYLMYLMRDVILFVLLGIGIILMIHFMDFASFCDMFKDIIIVGSEGLAILIPSAFIIGALSAIFNKSKKKPIS